MTTAIVVQARMRSTRLPGKVMLPLAGAPALLRQIERILAARPRRAFEVVVATTDGPSDDALAALCRRAGLRCVRGHPDDLLDRHLAAARAVGADLVVKIPSDCPLVDPAAIEAVLDAWDASDGRYDFLSNLHPPSWPDGNDVEVLPRAVLEEAHREARAPHEREHTTPFVWDHPERYRVGNVRREGRDLSREVRLTVDYREDYALVSAVFDALWTRERPGFSTDEIVAFLAREPEVAALNAAYRGVNWYRHHLDALRTVSASDTRPEPHVASSRGAA